VLLRTRYARNYRLLCTLSAQVHQRYCQPAFLYSIHSSASSIYLYRLLLKQNTTAILGMRCAPIMRAKATRIRTFYLQSSATISAVQEFSSAAERCPCSATCSFQVREAFALKPPLDHPLAIMCAIVKRVYAFNGSPQQVVPVLIPVLSLLPRRSDPLHKFGP
jgi:hypothetical protein